MKSLIHNNKVVEIKEQEFPVHSSMKWVECPNNVEPGWQYIDDEFIPPEEEYISLKEKAYNSYLVEMRKGFEYFNTVFQCTPYHINEWVKLFAAIQTLKDTDVFEIRDMYNNWITRTVSELKIFAKDMQSYVLTTKKSLYFDVIDK